MKNILNSFCLLFLTSSLVSAQLNQYQMSNSMSLSNGIGVGEQFFASKPYQKQVKGSRFLFDNWNKASLNITGTNKTFTTDSLKYDVLGNYFDIEIANTVKSISGNYVLEFEIENNGETRHYVAAKNYYTPEGSPMSGFVELVYDQEVTLIAHPYIMSKKATYNQALMLGERDDEIIVKERYYFINNKDQITQFKRKKDLKRITEFEGCRVSKISREELLNCLKQ